MIYTYIQYVLYNDVHDICILSNDQLDTSS